MPTIIERTNALDDILNPRLPIPVSTEEERYRPDMETANTTV